MPLSCVRTFLLLYVPPTPTPLQTVLWESESVTQSCLTLCNPMDCSPPGSTVLGILQARILEWLAISLSRGSSWPRAWTWVSCIAGRFFTIWVTREALLLLLPLLLLSRFSHVWLLTTPWRLQPTRLLRPWDFPGKSTGGGCHRLLQGKPYTDLKKNLAWSTCFNLSPHYFQSHIILQLCGQGGHSHARTIRKEHIFCAELGRMEHSVSTIPTLEVPTQREGNF